MNYKLSDVCDVRDGTHDSPKYVEEGYPLVTSKNIVNGKLDLSNVNYISQDDYDKINLRSKVDVGDIIMPMIGTIGNPLLIGEYTDFAIKNVSLIKFNTDKVLNKYIFYFLQSNKFKNYIQEKNRGGTQKFLSLKDIRNINIPVVSLGEQEEIVLILEKIENIINLRIKQLELFDELIKSIFVEMFNGKCYPKTTIEKLVFGKVSSVKKDFSQDDTIKYIDISSIDNKKNIMTGYTEYVLSEAPSRAQQHIIKDDIVVSTVRPNLRNIAITTFDEDNLVASSGFCILRTTKCLPSYLMAIVCSDSFTDAMSKVVTGANYPAIKDSDVLNYEVLLPPIECQKRFDAVVTQIDKLKLTVNNLLERAELIKKSLMQEYFG